MPLVTTTEMFEKSMKGHYAIGAFNINNMEFIQAITEAANEAKSPVILQVSSSAIKYAGLKYLLKMVEAAVEETDIPIALHLDHGPDFETCKMCIDAGFTSVMIDGSKYDFEENVALTKKVVDYAHSKGVVVEAELGKLAGIEDDVNKMEINEGKNVTDVLASVSEGSNEIGIVYATDAASVADKVDIIAEAPAGSLETPVLYPVGLTEDAEASESEAAAADAFLAYLQTDDALKVFEEYGFAPYTAEETADDAEAEATEEAVN